MLLMHYRENTVFGGVTSEADAPSFFNAPNGTTNPQAELEATLARFFSTEILEPGKQTAQCTFVARYHWLKKQLGFDANRLPQLPCPRFDRWISVLDPGSVSLVFATYYLNNPASMFGHTLLVFNKRGRAESSRMLNYAVNFGAAVPDEEPGVLFALKGLMGGYIGGFSLLPYYLKLREYSDIESRDLWEYEILLEPEQLTRMVRHAWEMGATYFDYYFLDENCSYHLLSLLEVAEPRFRLRDRFLFWTIPIDTVRAVLEQPDVNYKVRFRPSRGRRLEAKLSHLSEAEQELVRGLIENPDHADDPAFQRLMPARQALLMDAAVDFFQYKIAGAKRNADPKLKAALRNLLLRRSRVGARALDGLEVPRPPRPDLGHRSARIGLSAGAANSPGAESHGEPFQEIALQPSFHQFMSSDSGFAPNSQINGLMLRLRHEDASRRTRLEEFAFVDVISLAPMTHLEKLPSWKVKAGWLRSRDGACADCVPFSVNGGIGLALQSNIFSREVYYAIAELDLVAEDELEKGYRAGLGALLGLVVDFTAGWRMDLQGKSTHYSEGQQGTVEESSVRQRFRLSTNLELNLDFSWRNDYREGKLTLGYYY